MKDNILQHTHPAGNQTDAINIHYNFQDISRLDSNQSQGWNEIEKC